MNPANRIPAGKNKIVQNAGYKNVRDGVYWRQIMQSYGGQLTPFSSRTAGLRIISGKDAGIDNGIGWGKMCPPMKISNLRDTIVVFNYPGDRERKESALI